MIISYLNNRVVDLKTATGLVQRRLTKGCPHGSVLGPVLWDVLFETLLEINFGPRSEVVAYAR